MRSKLRSRFVFIIAILLMLGALAIWYKATYSMGEITTYQINPQEGFKKIAIATQGSQFKDTIVSNILNHYKKEDIFINVFDVSKLNTLTPKEYNAIVILHTWEYGSPPDVVLDFIEVHAAKKEKLIVLATSGQGSNKIAGIDALAGASILENASDYSDRIIERIEKILQ